MIFILLFKMPINNRYFDIHSYSKIYTDRHIFYSKKSQLDLYIILYTMKWQQAIYIFIFTMLINDTHLNV